MTATGATAGLPDPDAGASTRFKPAGSDPEVAELAECYESTAARRIRRGKTPDPTKISSVRNRNGTRSRISHTVTLEEYRAQENTPPRSAKKNAAATPESYAPPGYHWEKAGYKALPVNPPRGIFEHTWEWSDTIWSLRLDGYEEPDFYTPPVERYPMCIECGSRPARSKKGGKCDACRKRKERS